MDMVAADHDHVPWLNFSTFVKTVLMSRGEDGAAVHKTETQQHNGVRDRLKALLNMFTEVYALDEVPDLEDVFFNKSDKGKTRGIFTEAKVEFDNKNLFGKMQRCSAHLELSGRGAMCWNRSQGQQWWRAACLGGKGGADVGGGTPGPERDRGRHDARVRAAIGTSSSGAQGPGQREQCTGRRTR